MWLTHHGNHIQVCLELHFPHIPLLRDLCCFLQKRRGCHVGSGAILQLWIGAFLQLRISGEQQAIWFQHSPSENNLSSSSCPWLAWSIRNQSNAPTPSARETVLLWRAQTLPSTSSLISSISVPVGFPRTARRKESRQCQTQRSSFSSHLEAPPAPRFKPSSSFKHYFLTTESTVLAIFLYCF